MEITERELGFLNFYRASELHGGLILGQVARRVRDPVLAVELTRHSAEEVTHSLLWTETIVAVGGRLHVVRETYQARYARLVGAPTASTSRRCARTRGPSSRRCALRRTRTSWS